MSEKKHSWIHDIKSESPESLPLDILKAYLDYGERNKWSVVDDASEDTKRIVEKANNRIDEECDALRKAILKLESDKETGLKVELETLKVNDEDRKQIISGLKHIIRELMDLDYNTEIIAEVYEMPKGVSAQSSVSFRWTTTSLFTNDLKCLMELRPECCEKAEDGFPRVDVRINSSYYDEEAQMVKPYNGKFEIELSVYFSENDWEKHKLMK